MEINPKVLTYRQEGNESESEKKKTFIPTEEDYADVLLGIDNYNEECEKIRQAEKKRSERRNAC